MLRNATIVAGSTEQEGEEEKPEGEEFEQLQKPQEEIKDYSQFEADNLSKSELEDFENLPEESDLQSVEKLQELEAECTETFQKVLLPKTRKASPDEKYIETLLTLESLKLQATVAPSEELPTLEAECPEHFSQEPKDNLDKSVFDLLPDADVNLNVIKEPIVDRKKRLKSAKSHVQKASYLRQFLQGITARLFSTAMPSSDSLQNTEVRVLTLNDNEHLDSTLFRIEKSWILQFRIGPSLYGRKVHIYTNYSVTSDDYPSKQDEEFIRNQYRVLPWYQDVGCKYSDDTSAYCEIEARRAGSYHYYFTYDKTEMSGPQGSGFFIVDPILKYGRNEELLLDCIQCQTVLAKQLGPFTSWENKLRVTRESGYNMIHFTPIQQLGQSNSCYSLSDQLKLNPLFSDGSSEISFGTVQKLVAKMRTEWKITAICDIVLNHTANESKWLQEHPECTYNCVNSPHLRPAYLLDATLHLFTLDVERGDYQTKGIPCKVDSEDHLNAIRHVLLTELLPKINIPDMYMCNANKLAQEFLRMARNRVPPVAGLPDEDDELKLIRDPQYRRLRATVDFELALRLYNVYRIDCFDEETRLKRCSEEFKKKLDQLNKIAYDEIHSHLTAAVENCIAGIRYFRVQDDGPRIKEVNVKHPLVPRYFTDHGMPTSLADFEQLLYGPDGKYLMAHNGWVMDADPLKNFAAADSNVYIRRELIAWGDSVKLRYGEKPDDCPFLWKHMQTYVEQTAKIFDGVRLDNCHSTPIAVAEYMLDCARKVRPDLYVVAELFTNSDQKDNIFVNRLGITSLIREAMSAWDSHEEGRLVYRYGGVPVGGFYQPSIRPLVPSVAHALFMDLTHDNPSPVSKRSVFDLLPSAALVSMACCASGSNRGYDELVPHHIHVVDETRQYAEWADSEKQLNESVRYVNSKSGIIAAKNALNKLHFYLGMEGFSQVFVDQIDQDIVAVTRHCPESHQSVILVAFTAFSHPNRDSANYQRDIKPLKVEGVLEEIVLEASLSHKSANTGGSRYTPQGDFQRDEHWIHGLAEYQVSLKENIQLNQSDVFEQGDSGDANILQLNFKNLKPGSVVAIRVKLQKNVLQSITKLRELITSFANPVSLDQTLMNIVGRMDLVALNRALYRCDEEERDDGKGLGVYNIPNFGPLVYCGLQGFISLLATVRPNNDLGHPMCGNLRDGNWMIDYIWQRLKVDQGTLELGQWLENNLKFLKEIPRYLIPCYFDVIVTGTYLLLIEQCYNLMGDFVKQGSTFVRGLALGSVQCGAVIKSARLPILSPNLNPPVLDFWKNDRGELEQASLSLSAGLPHFAVGYMRSWGRDTFIALRGLFILTGRYSEARFHILGYAACLRHGLIPNLLDGGKNARYNCRDAIWWWLYCIQSYVKEAPSGTHLLTDKVSRLYPTDDSPALEPGKVDQPLHDVIQEALNVHFQGLVFRERNAGRSIDAHMSDRGFNNQIGVHPETGFVFGGNESNCGTWMDKMGSSEKAGNRGKPATPRDGSAVELVALCKSTMTWLAELHAQGKYPYAGVQRKHRDGNLTNWTYKQWSDKIHNNFEKCFWINTVPVPCEKRPDLVHRRGMYKDCFGASQQWSDYQLRCNVPVAMVAAPEMFDPQHAWIALKKVEELLLGPLGMKTLDPKDWAYCGDYDNANDSNDPKVAHGFNYHQGPEWLWPLGYFLRARLHFSIENGELKRTVASTKAILSKHFTELQTSTWRGLPELTNAEGQYCSGSCRAQAWSMASILEVLYDLQKLEEQEPILLCSEY
ncbi:uncharacterized protein CBL_10290 [Carabus blaptoides fortunei]